MTIRQVVSLAFGKVQKSPEAKRVGVLVFQELCFLSREENGVWLKRSTTSPMSVALGVELVETILSAHARLFRTDDECLAVLKQHVCSLMQSALETACLDAKSAGVTASSSSSTSTTSSSLASAALSSLSGGSNSSSNSLSNSSTPFFSLLVRVMRLASVVLCNFSDIMPDECAVILQALLEVISTGAFAIPGGSKSPGPGKLTHESKSFFSHSNSGSSSIGLSSSGGTTSLSTSAGSNSSNGSHGHSVSLVTWPVLLALEVLNRVSTEATMVFAIARCSDTLLGTIARTVASVVTTSPPVDFRPQGADAVVVTAPPRSGLELLNDQDSPSLQPFFHAIRVAVSCQSNLVASMFDLSRSLGEEACQPSEELAVRGVQVVAPHAVQTFNCTMRHCREVELIQISLKSHHVLATIASRLRANMVNQEKPVPEVAKRMDEIVLACLRALCAFSFPLPENTRSAGKSGNIGNGPSSSNGIPTNSVQGDGGYQSDGESSHDEGDASVVVMITWREVHAMKAMFSAAHIMEEEMAELEWCVLLEAFEIIVGLTDAKLKGGQNKLPTRNYRISMFRVEDEDVEQQLVMLGNSIVEFFRDALKLSSSALRRLTAALRKVCWDQLSLPHPHRDVNLRQEMFQSVHTAARTPNAGTSASGLAPLAADPLDAELPSLAAGHQMKMYQNYLGVGLTGSGTYNPSFVLRMLSQLATNSKRCFEDVMLELVAISTFTLQPPATPAQFPQLTQLQLSTTDSIIHLMENALQNVINSLSPTTKLPSDATLEQIEEHARLHASEPHIFDQDDLFKPLLQLMRSDMKDRALTGVLELLNACGHLVNIGWPLILRAIQEACEIGDAKTQVVAFKCLRLIVDDLLSSMPRMYLPHCVTCIGRFACCAKDVNISLTAVNELWSVADIIGKSKQTAPVLETPALRASTSQWGCVFAELSVVALDDRTEVRNSAINTLFGTAATYGVYFELTEWQLFVNDTVLPLAAKLHQGRELLSSNGISEGKSGIKMHHSRDSAQKQWDESRVLMLSGISRVLQTNCQTLLAHQAWFAQVWKELLQHVALNSTRSMSKDVVLAAVNTLQTMLQVSSAADFDQITQMQPVRAGAGMRVVGGALVASATSSAASAAAAAKRHAQHNALTAAAGRDEKLWEDAFTLLLKLCHDRQPSGEASASLLPWREDDEQEISSSVVAVLITLYSQAKDYEFKHEQNVVRMLDLFDVLVMRHVLQRLDDPEASKSLSNVTTNSLQSRVLNAFEECGSFAAHPVVHTKALDQLVRYVTMSSQKDGLVFFTRHALISLAKLYASVSTEARRERFSAVLQSTQTFLQLGEQRDRAASPPPSTAAQKAAAQQWKHALRVLLVLISHGLAAVRLAEHNSWRQLLDTITLFLAPSSGSLPSFVDGEEDEALVLSVLECLVDSVIALFSGQSRAQLRSESEAECTSFNDALMGLLCSGVDATQHCKPLVKCCVRQLATLALQREDDRLAHLARSYLVRCCNVALQALAAREASLPEVRGTDATLGVAAAAPETDDASVSTARDRVVILLSSASEVGLSTRSVLEMFASLCGCITSGDAQVRRLIQRLLLNANIVETCLAATNGHAEADGDDMRREMITASSMQRWQG
ncbi:hypothetical protein PINS_up005911 [Pythium insidiosum]|nr:hypothetical protein PINS_up005911 [Pythium insidiosum]